MGKGIFKIIMISFLLLGADMAQVRSAAPTDFENTGKIQLILCWFRLTLARRMLRRIWEKAICD